MIPTYSWLKAEISDHLRRPDLIDKSDVFILLAETRINNDRNLVCSELKKEVSLTVDYVHIDSPVLAKPDDMSRLIGIFFIDYKGCRVKLEPSTEDESCKYTFSTPAFFDLRGDHYAIFPKSIGHDVQFIIQYYQKIPALSDSNQTNWTISNAPDLYLYASLLAATPYIQDDERVPIWMAGYENAREMLNAASHSRAFGDRIGYSYYGGP